MAVHSYTIPDAIDADVIEAFAVFYDFTNRGGGLTKAQFYQKKVCDHIRQVYLQGIGRAALTAAQDAAEDAANDIV